MAQTRKRRRRKHRGTQGGRVDRKRSARPRSRQEARDRARAKRGGPRMDRPPTWRSAINRGLVAAGLFAVLLLLIFRRPVLESIAFGFFMLAFYIPMGYFIDTMIWRRRERSRMRSKDG
jgi:hypothetical protein